jgi:hypothetical protein
MMGIKNRSFAPPPHDLSPEENIYRSLGRTLDLSFVRELAYPFYVRCGCPSVDSVVYYFKLQLVMFFENLRSRDRARARQGCSPSTSAARGGRPQRS